MAELLADEPSAEFQSTHPVRGAINFHNLRGERGEFQSTHPVRGATMGRTTNNSKEIFQSTHPVRGATASLGVLTTS